MMGFNNGIAVMSSTVTQTVQNIADNVKSTIQHAMQIHSPSRVMEKLGEFTGLGYAKGGENTLPVIRQTAGKMADASIPYCNDYTPSSSVAYNRSSTSENVNYAPVFNLTISGTSDDRAMARKIKKMIGEAMEDMVSSYESKSRTVREV